MCGIIGVVGELPGQKKIEYARDILKHRGPDDAGLYYNPKDRVAFGHRRLSIIDLSSDGHQPFFSQDKRFIVVFNGEIYNYIELKEELKDFYNFRTKTDTEVLLASYLKWGSLCLDKFNGMFAFVIWDAKKKELFCARDRLGVKPFYYSINNSTFYFASEIKALLALDIKVRPNEGIIFDYLNYGFYDHSDETFFGGIKKLTAGHYLIWKNGKSKTKKYWELSEKQGDFFLTFKQAEEKFRQLLEDSIKLRFRSDIPVGLNLSSGLDSNSILHFSRHIVKNDLFLFSIGTFDDEYNECLLINRILTSKQKRFWRTSYFEKDGIFPHGAEKMNYIQDQPYGGISTISYNNLMAKARENNISVLLEGQGGDELLAGYKYYQIEYQKDLLEQKRYKEFKKLSKALGDDFGKRAKGGFKSQWGYSQDTTLEIDNNILSENFLNGHKHRQLLFDRPFDSNLLNAQYRDLMYTKLPRVLRFNDHVSMAYSIELRLPLLDYRIVEFCFNLPVDFKIKNQEQKVLMREAMKNFIPKVIKNKAKNTFGAIQKKWFEKHFREEILSYLNSNFIRQSGFWNKRKLEKRVEEFFAGKIDNSFFIWQFINLDIWFKKYFKK